MNVFRENYLAPMKFSYYYNVFKNITIGDYLLLYNRSKRELYGVFVAISKAQKNIVPEAWEGKYPYQIKVNDNMLFDLPIKLDTLKHRISWNDKRDLPLPQYPPQQFVLLLNEFQKVNCEIKTSIRTEYSFPDDVNYFIISEDKEKGAITYDTNKFGVPTSFSRLKEIQPNDVIFLWLKNDRRLYGVWRVINKAKYDPISFQAATKGDSSGVFECIREHDFQKGISEEKLRILNILKESKPYPLSKIDFKTATNLLDEFKIINHKEKPFKIEQSDERISDRIKTKDGHLVRSRGEHMIDQLLYDWNVVHTYESILPFFAVERYCDFYCREKDVYIEHWGFEKGENIEYDRRKEEKINLYRKNGLKLIEIEQKHLRNLETFLKRRLEVFGYRIK